MSSRGSISCPTILLKNLARLLTRGGWPWGEKWHENWRSLSLYVLHPSVLWILRTWTKNEHASLTFTENRDQVCISTYKCSGILVHDGSSTHSFTESFLDKLWRREVRKPLSKVHCFVVCCQLCEFNPVGAKLPVNHCDDIISVVWSMRNIYDKHLVACLQPFEPSVLLPWGSKHNNSQYTWGCSSGAGRWLGLNCYV